MNTPATEYVLGLMFSACRDRVALIRKSKPAWQRGKLNGIGGKIEADESKYIAMHREFREETGYEGHPDQWSYFLRMEGQNDDGAAFAVHCFTTFGDLDLLHTMEQEKVEIIFTKETTALANQMIDNLPWVIHLALDYLSDGRPGFVVAKYGN